MPGLLLKQKAGISQCFYHSWPHTRINVRVAGLHDEDCSEIAPQHLIGLGAHLAFPILEPRLFSLPVTRKLTVTRTLLTSGFIAISRELA